MTTTTRVEERVLHTQYIQILLWTKYMHGLFVTQKMEINIEKTTFFIIIWICIYISFWIVWIYDMAMCKQALPHRTHSPTYSSTNCNSMRTFEMNLLMFDALCAALVVYDWCVNELRDVCRMFTHTKYKWHTCISKNSNCHSNRRWTLSNRIECSVSHTSRVYTMEHNAKGPVHRSNNSSKML